MASVRKVLFPSKFEELSFQAVEALYPLRRAGLEEIIFLFVVDRDEVGFIPFGGFDKSLAEQFHEEARLRFADWVAAVERSGLRAKAIVEIGRPAAKILEVAGREAADLIVAGRQRRLQDGAAHVGATTLEVLRRSPVPVLVARAPSGEPPTAAANAYEHLLYATDFSADSARALKVLEALAGAVKRVTVVHVLSERDFRRHSAEGIEMEEKADRAELEEVCSELRAAGLEARSHVRAGNVVREILGAAEDEGCTGLILGTKGRDAFTEFLIGSVSHRVAELSSLPVILVPAPRDEP
jgi:nucleotide-binding universal stress UspA family protein